MKSEKCCVNLEREFVFFAQQKGVGPSTWRQLSTWLHIKLRGLGQGLSRSLSLSLEPQITCHQDRQGNPSYRIYDPTDKAHYVFVNEESVRIWLEERHHR